jgi:uncharacterized membrane protein YvbJ
MKKCVKCGNENLDQNFRCIECGASLSPDPEPALTTKRQKFLAKLPVIIIVITVAAAIIIGLYYVIYHTQMFPAYSK